MRAVSIGTCIGGLSIDDAYIALAAHTIQSTSGSQITGTLSWTADKVYTELIQGLDTKQTKLLRTGYVQLCGGKPPKTLTPVLKCNLNSTLKLKPRQAKARIPQLIQAKLIQAQAKALRRSLRRSLAALES